MLICTLISGPIYGQSDNSYKSVNIDSLLAVPITLQKDKDYGIYNLIFPVYYTGEIRMMGVSVHERLYLLKKAHPHVNFSICNCNTVGVFKTRDNNTLLMTFSEDELLNKLRPYDQPKTLKVKVKRLIGKFKPYYAQGDFVIQDIEVIKK